MNEDVVKVQEYVEYYLHYSMSLWRHACAQGLYLNTNE
jgi:hypothetical protein